MAVKPGAQVMERIQEHTAVTNEQEEIDRLRKDWLMGKFERKPSRKKM